MGNTNHTIPLLYSEPQKNGQHGCQLVTCSNVSIEKANKLYVMW
jgi:hypothetical protein